MDGLLLRFDAPLMSFGGVLVDQLNPTDRFPGRSLLAGLLANALGWDHADGERIGQLQTRLRHAARWDIEPTLLVDYHTVDLGQTHLLDTGWTTRGRVEKRGGGDAKTATHQRWRHYWANGVATLALTLREGEGPTLDDLEHALRRPARPLFIGRKTCLPAAPLLLGRFQAANLREGLAQAPQADEAPGRTRAARMPACWPADEAQGQHEDDVYDLRDWRNNLHRGSQRYAFGFLETPA